MGLTLTQLSYVISVKKAFVKPFGQLSLHMNMNKFTTEYTEFHRVVFI